jgi:hypothetical protein
MNRLQMFARDTASWLSRVAAWVIELREWHNLWLLLGGVVLCSLAAYFLFVGCVEQQVRYSGMFLELSGLALVARDLNKRAHMFKLSRPWDVARGWWDRRPRFRVAQAAAFEVSGRGGVVLGGAAVSASVSLGPAPTLEQRVASLEGTVVGLQQQQDKLSGRLDDERRERHSALEAERSEREAGDMQARVSLKRVAGDDLGLEIVGLAWLLLGLVFSNTSQEIAKLLSR